MTTNLIPMTLNMCQGGSINVDVTEYDEDTLERKLPLVKKGGVYRPSSCRSRHKVAIIIPYRNRKRHLRILLNNLHALLQRQQLDYRIFVIELAPNVDFNRALCMNIGFLEATKKYGYQCLIFHDVDLIPENDNNMYSCPENPRHMSVAVDKFNYQLPYMSIFGGVTAMTKEHFETVNGYSNKFFGWGGEDDDIYNRIRNLGVSITRYTPDVSSYRMLNHHSDPNLNEKRFSLLGISLERWKEDGLNTIKYEVLQTVERRLYTYILADINQDDWAYQPWTKGSGNVSRDDALDSAVEELLMEKAKYLLKKSTLDDALIHKLKQEFRYLNTSHVTMGNVALVIRKLFPVNSAKPVVIPQLMKYSSSTTNQTKDNSYHIHHHVTRNQSKGPDDHMHKQERRNSFQPANILLENQKSVQFAEPPRESHNQVYKQIAAKQQQKQDVKTTTALQESQQHPYEPQRAQVINRIERQNTQSELQNPVQNAQTQEKNNASHSALNEREEARMLFRNMDRSIQNEANQGHGTIAGANKLLLVNMKSPETKKRFLTGWRNFRQNNLRKQHNKNLNISQIQFVNHAQQLQKQRGEYQSMSLQNNTNVQIVKLNTAHKSQWNDEPRLQIHMNHNDTVDKKGKQSLEAKPQHYHIFKKSKP
ncbi:uncharacterized protein LOC132558087 [Ylistrum balloti]|uniref:uncharacterized protein LOC132558087 n=1 Tax=Ylistrum balloti TaxID=509963 RepID=UPI002905E3F4|nr:uncharacterized protein LOC132558087 [Ylistrum balloti]